VTILQEVQQQVDGSNWWLPFSPSNVVVQLGNAQKAGAAIELFGHSISRNRSPLNHGYVEVGGGPLRAAICAIVSMIGQPSHAKR